ncbi:hypothetical protein C7M61_001014 [Candidozyma pseudohaemuli]|uniref:Regulator of phospholipase D SRF1 n=1 Tax=Candidozyma pseudohaemuli TaxID=418784 RepID=A0A2P7YZE7_9ASCO|nr:hypothetical protein C7M61_001014 [[Candida] pseudohaemulonii]PSK41333.1 hypothetical protein C7M61_001014 [[Candida] pseudohaemulonii]
MSSERHSNAKADQNGNFYPLDPVADTPLLFYSQTAALVPTYVLDRLAQAHHREQNNTNVNNGQADISHTLRAQHQNKWDDEEQYQLFANDPFVKSIGGNWSNFIKTVRMPEVYPPDRMDEVSTLAERADFNEPWGGDERLRLALLGASSNDSVTDIEKSPGLFGKMFHKNTQKPDEKVRHRSQAGYWMSDEKRAILVPTLKRIFINNPLVPLLLRILILIFCVTSLALACTIYVNSNKKYEDFEVPQQAGTIMAIVVNCFAVVYVVYIAYDEYSGKPMGLRNPLGKMKLIMLDLFFIIFSSANLSLAFNSITDREWVCHDSNSDVLKEMGIFYPPVSSLCRRQKALTSFLILALFMWVLTFTISIIRVVERVTVGESRTE